MRNGMRIGELAERTGADVATIHYYERVGLLPRPARSEGNYRLYDAADVERLSFVRHCRSLDMALDEIRALLRFRATPERNCEQVNWLLDEHIGHVAARVEELKRLEAQLKQLRRLCRKAQATKDCGILNGLAQRSARSPERRAGHVRGAHARRHGGDRRDTRRE